MGIGTILLWAAALYSLWIVFTFYRAKQSVAYLRQVNADRFKLDLHFFEESELPVRVLKSFAAKREQLLNRGFTPLACYTNTKLVGSIGGENYIAAFRSADGMSIASMSYYHTPRRVLLFFPIPLYRITGELLTAEVLESDFEGRFLNTHNLSIPVGEMPEEIIVQAHPPGTGITELIEAHESAALRLRDEVPQRQINNLGEYVDYYQRLQNCLCAKPYVDVDALLDEHYASSPEVREFIDPS